MEDFGPDVYINKTVRPELNLLQSFLDIEKLSNNIYQFPFLSFKKKSDLLDELSILPKQVKVANSPSQLEVDILINWGFGRKMHIEFHEEQHRKLSDARTKYVYTPEGHKIPVPRFVQRFLRDIWKFKNLEGFKIVWWDWFQENPNTNLKTVLASKQKEFHKANKFSFSDLLGNY
ncbi:MAG: hypothetical protein LUF90_07000 [Rikenellaceae bacterium]|nr:hypothetical protein [Rikenellaceae bacterium]